MRMLLHTTTVQEFGKSIGRGFEELEQRLVPTMVGDDIFLRGEFIEAGIHRAGSFGTAQPAGAG